MFLGIQIPHIVAGDNLDMPVVGKLLKSSGAIFIRREWGNDELYKTVLEEYMAALLAQGSKFFVLCVCDDHLEIINLFCSEF